MGPLSEYKRLGIPCMAKVPRKNFTTSLHVIDLRTAHKRHLAKVISYHDIGMTIKVKQVRREFMRLHRLFCLALRVSETYYTISDNKFGQ